MTPEQIAAVDALADAAAELARALGNLNSELCDLRDEMRASLRLAPIDDERQETMQLRRVA